MTHTDHVYRLHVTRIVLGAGYAGRAAAYGHDVETCDASGCAGREYAVDVTDPAEIVVGGSYEIDDDGQVLAELE